MSEDKRDDVMEHERCTTPMCNLPSRPHTLMTVGGTITVEGLCDVCFEEFVRCE